MTSKYSNWRATDWAFTWEPEDGSHVDAYVRLTLICIARRTSPEGLCWPSLSALAKDGGMSRRTVIRSITWLEERGALTVEVGGGSNPNTYRIAFQNPIGRISTPVTAIGGSDCESLGGDTESPGVVTESHRGSDTESLGGDTESPGVVTHSHRGGDCESPEVEEEVYTSSRSLSSLVEPHQRDDADAPPREQAELFHLDPPPSPPKPDRFDEFWSMQLRKVGKASARKAWTAALAGKGPHDRPTDPDEVIDGYARQLPSLRAKVDRDGSARYVPHPATWLNRGQWTDETDDRSTGTSPWDRLGDLAADEGDEA